MKLICSELGKSMRCMYVMCLDNDIRPVGGDKIECRDTWAWFPDSTQIIPSMIYLIIIASKYSVSSGLYTYMYM